MANARLDALVLVHLERERPNGHEQAEEQQGEDHERRGHDEDREHDRADREGGREEVVGRLVDQHVGHEHPDRREEHEPGEAAEVRDAQVEVEETVGAVGRAQAHQREGGEERGEAEPCHRDEALPQAERRDGGDRE